MAAAYSDSFVEGVSTGSGTTYTPTATLTVPSGGVIYVYVATSDSSVNVPTGVYWDTAGVNESFGSTINNSGTIFTYYNGTLWVLKNPTAKTGQISVTLGTANGEIIVCAWTGTGIDTTTPNGTIGTGTNTTTTASATATTTTGQLVLYFAHGCLSGTGLAFNNADGTERENGGTQPDEYDLLACQEKTASGASTSAQWTFSNGSSHPWYMVAIPLNDASASGGVPMAVILNSNQIV